jgi:UDP-3-O-[3-hydroxymyristoyl] glucosamine N-acyltransferase
VKVNKIFTASSIANELGLDFNGNDLKILTLGSLRNPRAGALSFARENASIDEINDFLGAEGVLFLTNSSKPTFSGTYILSNNPEESFARAVRTITDYQTYQSDMFLFTSINQFKTSDAKQSLKLMNTTIDDTAVIQPGVSVGRNVVIGANSFIKSGAVIGSSGLGSFRNSQDANEHFPHIGGVVIGDNVEIGCLSTVAAGTLDPTVISSDVHMDDHVHVAHNCKIGKNSILTANVTLSGSTKIGRNCWLGVSTSTRDGVSICDNVFLGMGSLVVRDIDKPGQYFGSPARFIKS